MQLNHGLNLDHATTALNGLSQKALNIRGRGGQTALDLRDNYLAWVEDAELVLTYLFVDPDRVAELHSPRYWEIRRLTADTPRPYPLVNAEIERQVERIASALNRLKSLETFIGRSGSIVVPDTSALVEGVFFDQFDWATECASGDDVRLIIPILVLEELDQIKDRERGRAQKRARSVAKHLRELARSVAPGEPVAIRKGATFEVLLDDEWHQRRYIPDLEIISQALWVQSTTGREVLLATADASMEFRARPEGLRVFDMPLADESDAQSASGS